ncbi:hypothetical protein RHMOL_Rhmol04G0225300 [Rhododendron molle]|uniref:Uncharacterized protein n=1 Tax=Rhododendron molle TaxID=49168 RepID=A0ACC0P3K8_RHOML|nr:hypothetical protein RHMOL_Rhmol04G0225300 [Rhododendron molle]
MPRGRGVPKGIARGLKTTQRGLTRGATSAGTSQRVLTRELANALRGVAKGVARGIPTSDATTNGVLTRGLANAQREGVASERGKRVSATIGDESVVGTGIISGGVRAARAKSDRGGATRTGGSIGTSGGAEIIEAGTMIRHGKKIYLKSHQSQQGWKIARIGEGVFSSKATKGSTKGSTQ